jgi:hypothetical protein
MSGKKEAQDERCIQLEKKKLEDSHFCRELKKKGRNRRNTKVAYINT